MISAKILRIYKCHLFLLSQAVIIVYNAVECCYISAERSETPKALPNAELLFVIPEGYIWQSVTKNSGNSSSIRT